MHETRSNEGCLPLAVYRKPNVLFSTTGDISARAAQAATKMVPICSTPTPTLCNWALLQVTTDRPAMRPYGIRAHHSNQTTPCRPTKLVRLAYTAKVAAG
jgi:hypothetical protein